METDAPKRHKRRPSLRVDVYLSESQLARLDRAALRVGLSRSAYVKSVLLDKVTPPQDGGPVTAG